MLKKLSMMDKMALLGGLINLIIISTIVGYWLTS